MDKEAGNDFLYLLGHLAWRLVQVLVVTAATAAVVWGVGVQLGLGRQNKEQVYIAAMTSDLRNLVVAQEAYFAEHEAYGSLGELSYRPNAGVTVVLGQLTRTGWSATATHVGTRYGCSVFVGDVAAARPGAVMGRPICGKP